MKLTVEKILTVLSAMGHISKVSMPYALARQTALLHRWLREECKTAAEREGELVKLYGGEYDPGSGRNKFESAGSAEAFSLELKELLSTEIDCPYEKLCLGGILENLSLPAEALSALDYVADFESGDSK